MEVLEPKSNRLPSLFRNFMRCRAQGCPELAVKPLISCRYNFWGCALVRRGGVTNCSLPGDFVYQGSSEITSGEYFGLQNHLSKYVISAPSQKYSICVIFDGQGRIEVKAVSKMGPLKAEPGAKTTFWRMIWWQIFRKKYFSSKRHLPQCAHFLGP